jgi:hypothetical protein
LWTLRPYRLGKTEEIGQQVMAYFSKYGFRMYLGSLDYVIFMSYPHYLPFLGSGSDLEAGRQTFRFNNQGVVTGCREGILYALVDSFAIVIDERRLPMDWH